MKVSELMKVVAYCDSFTVIHDSSDETLLQLEGREAAKAVAAIYGACAVKSITPSGSKLEIAVDAE